MAKVISKSAPGFVKGGSGGLSQKFVGTQKAGVSSQEGHGNAKFASGGGGNHMFSQGGANPMPAGETAIKSPSGKGAQFAKGGSTRMFGYTGVQAAQPGRSAK